MKKALKILVIIAIGIYFIGNILPNLIGVPLAAYQSYDAWSKSKNNASELISEYNSSTKFPESIGIVNDFNQVFTAEQRNILSKRLYNYDVETTRQIVVVTVDSIQPYTNIQKYATDLGNEWGVGKSEKDNGLIIVLCNPIRQIGIATGFGSEKILTDEICKNVIDQVIIPEFKNGKYYEGIDNGLSELIIQWK